MSTSKYKQRLAKERKAAAILAAQQAAERRRRLMIIGGVLGAILLVVVIAAVVVVSGGDSKSDSADAGDTSTTTSSSGFTYGTAACAPAQVPVPPQLDFPNSDGFQKCIDPSASYVATINTTAGQVTVQLDAAKQPGTVNNFVQLARYGYYDNSQLFRTDPSIGIIQGGAPHTNSATDPGPGFTIDDEGSGFTYQPGQLVMARTAQPNSAGSQFFFTVTDAGTQSLDSQGTYVVFGEVISGLDVLQQILATNVEGSGGLGGSPNPPVTVTSIVIGEASLVDGSSTTTVPADPPNTATTLAPATSSTTIDPSVSTPQSTSSTSIPA